MDTKSERSPPDPILTAEAFQRLTEGIEDVEQGRTVSLDEARERLGLEK